MNPETTLDTPKRAWFHAETGDDRLAVIVEPAPEHTSPLPEPRAPSSDDAAEPSTEMPSLTDANVLVIGINYAPEPTGIAPYTTGVAEELARHARSVTVLAGLPHYPSWTVPQAYRRRHRTEEPHQPGHPRVIRLAHYVPHTQTALRRALYEVTFLAHALWTAWSLTRRTRFDLVVTATPSLGGAVAAARIAQRIDVPLLTIVQDLMAKATAQSGISGGGAVTKTTARLEGYALRRATRVAVVSDSFRTAVEDYGVDSDRIGLLPNWTHVTPSTLDRDQARRRLGWDTDEFIVAHTGNIGLEQDLGTVVEAARLLTDEPDLAVLIIGDGSQRAAVAAQAKGVPTVRMLPPLDDEQYPLALAAADVLLVNERPSVGDMSLPSKLTSYLAATRPVLAAVAPDGATAAEVVASDAGVVVPAGDPAALATALVALRADPGRRLRLSQAAQGYARERLSAHTSMRRLADLACQAAPATRRKLRAFRPDGYDKGRGRLWQITWFVTMNLVFRAWWCPARLRPAILRAFGARVGKRVLIRHRVRVLWPWKLSIGDDCWVGEDAWLLNLEPITLANDVCLSQGAMLCTGSHDHRDRAFRYDNAPINVETGAWVAARATVLRGSRVPAGQVVAAGTTFRAPAARAQMPSGR